LLTDHNHRNDEEGEHDEHGKARAVHSLRLANLLAGLQTRSGTSVPGAGSGVQGAGSRVHGAG
jgi:hypothetical protein